jgi:hypothetical protein
VVRQHPVDHIQRNHQERNQDMLRTHAQHHTRDEAICPVIPLL